jgi:hypothetical protein
MALNYAILLKVHYWNASLAARVDELRRFAPSANIFIFVDETNKPVEIRTTVPVIRRTVADVSRYGLAAVPAWAVFWYNNDYPLYLSASQLIEFDYVLMLEHDALVTVDIDELIMRAGADGIDFAAVPISMPPSEWPWLPTLNGVYDLDAVRLTLNCTCLISRAAWMHLFSRRLRLSLEYAAGTLQSARQPLPTPPREGVIESWPFGEGLMATDLTQHGFKVVDLAEFGDTSEHKWWPPILLSELLESNKTGFFHPVLDEDNYITSLLRPSSVDPADWFVPGSMVHEGLEKCDPTKVMSALAASFQARKQIDNLKRLRSEVPREQWNALGLARDVRYGPHSSSESHPTDSPQWWRIDILEAHEVFELRLVPHQDPVPDEISVSISCDGYAWEDLGSLPPYAAASSHQPLSYAFKPSQRVRHVQLTTYSTTKLRTGELNIWIDP